MIEFHAIVGQQRELVAQVIDGKLVIPPAPASTPTPMVFPLVSQEGSVSETA